MSAFATAGVFLPNWLMMRETVRLRIAQTEPAISLHLERGRHLQFLNLVIQNYGQSVAYDLRWHVSPPIEELEKHDLTLGSLQLLNGFEHLAPKQRVETFLCSAVDAIATKCPPIVVAVTYRNAQGKPIAEKFTLNPCQFAGITEVGDTTEESIANSLEKLAKSVDRVTSQGRLQVASEDKPWRRNARVLRKELDTQIAAEAQSARHSTEPVNDEAASPRVAAT